MGREWYLNGKLNKKRNTFTDTIDVVVSPIIPPGWRKVPIHVKPTEPTPEPEAV